MLQRRSFIRRSVAAPVCLAIAGINVLSACGEAKPKFNNADITGSSIGGDFALTDHTGKPRALADFKGKVVAIFFGFTRCPDVCPTNLAEWAEVAKRLGPDADKLQVLFVTLDPDRDTPQLLAGYVPAFDKRFIGLYAATPEATKALADKYKVFYAKAPAKDGKDYTIDHTAASFVIDATGQTRLYVRHGQPVETLVADIRQLLPKG
jgi:protein SCO1